MLELCLRGSLFPLFAQELPVRNYKIADGLISNNVTDLCQDSLGFIWIATSEGLSRFDSKEFINYTTTNGLSSDDISCLLADRFVPGDVWIGLNGKGVDKYHNRKFKAFIIGSSRNQETANDLCQDSTGRVWCCTDNGLYFIQGDSTAEKYRWLASSRIYAVTISPTGKILVGTSSGIFYLDGMNNAPIPFVCPQIPPDKLSDFFLDSKNNLWVLTNTGKIILSRESNPREVFEARGIPELTRISEDLSHQIWISTGEGLIATTESDFEHGRFRRYDRNNGLPDDNLNCVMADREGLVWASSYRAGLMNLAGTGLIRFRFKHKENRMWSSVAVDRAGHFWVTDGLSLYELFRNTAGKWRMFSHSIPPVTRSDQFMKIVYNSTDDILFCVFASGRILMYKVAQRGSTPSLLHLAKRVNLKKYAKFTWLWTVLLDANGRLWCSLLDRGVAVMKRDFSGIDKLYTSPSGAPDISVRSLYQDSKGSMWLGGFDHGVSQLPPETLRAGDRSQSTLTPLLYTTENGLPDNAVRSIAQLKSGEMLIGTRYGGLALFRGDSMTCISRNNSKLMSNGIWNIQILSHHRVLLCTQAGVEEMFLDDGTHFLKLDRVPSDPFYSSALSKDGFSCFASGSDVFLYNTEDGSSLRDPFPVYLTGVWVNGKEMDPDQIGTLPSRISTMTFEFIEVTNRMTERGYRYRLMGVDENYRTLFGENSVTYAGLGPGKYTFQVYALNGDLENGAPVSLSFAIRTPLYARWYFLLLSTGVIILIILMFILQRVRRFTEVRLVRQRIARDLHDEIGSGLTKIAILSDYASIDLNSSGSEVARNTSRLGVRGDELPSVESPTDRIGRIARGLVDSVSDVVWSIDPKYDSLAEFIFTFRSYANEIVEPKGIALQIHANGLEKSKMGPQAKRVLQSLSKEALNNAVKYSSCKNITYSIEARNGRVFISFQDNGCGFDRCAVDLGNGINNMEKHVREIKGNFRIESSPGNGTKIQFDFSLKG